LDENNDELMRNGTKKKKDEHHMKRSKGQIHLDMSQKPLGVEIFRKSARTRA
jgi:hypothetical protein